jgi:hypothetical protein
MGFRTRRYGPPVTSWWPSTRRAARAHCLPSVRTDQRTSATEPAAIATARTAIATSTWNEESVSGELVGRRTLQTMPKPTPWRSRPTVPIESRVRSADAAGRRRKTKIAAKENQATRIATAVHS